MSYRTGSGQTIHDRVIAGVAAVQNRYDALTNPGHEHNWSIQIGQETVFPDVILCERGTRSVAHLIEVETADSVNEDESDQWATYARGPGQFWLLVPSTSLVLAQQICRRRSIDAHFGRWWIEGGSIRFEWVASAAA
jgi:hypothetical protein